ncbi:hypothetical protein IWZ01DRAFT_556628 [Phyllosticta capitalensis]
MGERGRQYAQTNDKPKSLGVIPEKETTAQLRCLICKAPRRATTAGIVPFDYRTLMTIVDRFALPDAFGRVCDYPLETIVTDCSRMDSDGIISWVASQYDFLAAWSYCIKTNTTTALVLIFEQTSWIDAHLCEIFKTDLAWAGAHALHPLLVPTILHSMQARIHMKTTEWRRGQIKELGDRTGVDRLNEPDEQFIDDFDHSVTTMSYYIAYLHTLETNVHKLYNCCERFLPEAMNQLQSFVERGLERQNFKDYPFLASTKQIFQSKPYSLDIRSRIHFNARAMEILLSDIKELIKRSELSNSVVSGPFI